jgi:chemotaxis protein CheZ
MTSGIAALRDEFGESIAALAGALAAGDEPRFLDELDALVERRERALFGELRKLTTDLQGALERFRIDSRLVDLAEKEVPDARHRLDHVLKLTD